MLSAEASTQNFSDINLRLENVGAGPAYDVHIDVSPPFVRVREVEEVPLSKARIFAKPIPMLPPNFSLVTWFDSAIERNNASMPAQHDVRIRYHDGHGHKWDERQVVDVNYLNDLLFTETYGVHHIAKSLRDIEKLLKKQVTHLENPIAVTTEARAEYEDRVRERNTARRRQLEQMQQDWRERQADAEVTDEADSANP